MFKAKPEAVAGPHVPRPAFICLMVKQFCDN